MQQARARRCEYILVMPVCRKKITANCFFFEHNSIKYDNREDIIMLKRFKVRNFKCFKDDIIFDLSSPNNYEFNTDAVKNGIINKAIIYGKNACGKSNLGLAIFDVVLHLTDKEKLFKKYPVYLNMNSSERIASFEYDFLFSGKDVIYKYTKTDMQNLCTEELIIDGKTVVKYDFLQDNGFSILDGTQNLRMESPDGKLSKIKFIRNNAILVDDETNRIFYQLMDFVDRMLMFYCVHERGYQGLVLGIDNIEDVIVKSGKLKEFERFLNKSGINESLMAVDINGLKQIHFKYKNGSIAFQQAASAGTLALELFYYWYLKISEASFVYIDEFDAFYHYELAEHIVKMLKEKEKSQVILTTQNTDLMSNDLLRPDCYFSLHDNRIISLANLTKKELRKAHNIQKMYKAGAFYE